jgi:hypothetical protein
MQIFQENIEWRSQRFIIVFRMLTDRRNGSLEIISISPSGILIKPYPPEIYRDLRELIEMRRLSC